MLMTYEEIVENVRLAYENADARNIFEHIAVQINITGEGEGIFYVEVAGRMVSVEPYDYYDHDALIVTDGETLKAIASGKLTFHKAFLSGKFVCHGNMDKLMKLQSIKLNIPKKKAKK